MKNERNKLSAVKAVISKLEVAMTIEIILMIAGIIITVWFGLIGIKITVSVLVILIITAIIKDDIEKKIGGDKNAGNKGN